MTKNFQAVLQQLDFQPMCRIPDDADRRHYHPDYRAPFEMPVGVVLRRAGHSHLVDRYVLVGNDVAGRNTTGCSCCSSEWSNHLGDFDGWAWVL